MAVTYEPIATTTLGSAQSTITFSSIPATYTDLRIVLVWKGNSSNIARLRFNSISTTTYSATYLDGTGSVAESNSQINLTYIDAGWNAVGSTQPAFTTFDIFSYAGSTFKTVLCSTAGDANGSGGIDTSVGMWRSTTAINAIELAPVGTPTIQFQTGTTATLYGILKA